MGVPPVIIHFKRIFSLTKTIHPAIGDPHDYGTPHVSHGVSPENLLENVDVFHISKIPMVHRRQPGPVSAMIVAAQ